MFITVNNQPLNVYSIVYYYSRDDIDDEGKKIYNVYYRITDGRVLTEGFYDPQDKDDRIAELDAISIGSGGSGGGSTPTKKSIIQKPTKADFPATGDTSTLYIAKDEKALYYWDSTKSEYIKATSDSSGLTIKVYEEDTTYNKGDWVVLGGASAKVARVIQTHTVPVTSSVSDEWYTAINSGKIELVNDNTLRQYLRGGNYQEHEILIDHNDKLYFTTKAFEAANVNVPAGGSGYKIDYCLAEDIKLGNLIEITGSGSSKLERTITSNKACGAAPSGTNFPKDMTFTEFAERLLLAEVLPTVQVTGTNSGLNAKGTTVTPTLTVKVTSQGTCTVNSIEFYLSSTLKDTQTYVSGTNQYTYTYDQVTTDTQCIVHVVYTKSDGTTGTLNYTINYNFANYSYFGATSGVPTASDINTLTQSLKSGKGFTGTINLADAHSVYAYPTSMGNLTSIKDANNFEYLASYTKLVLTVNGESYNVYYLTDPVTASNFKQIYV